MKGLLAAVAVFAVPTVAEVAVPASVVQQIPSGYEVIAAAHLSAGSPVRSFDIVALSRKGEERLRAAPEGAPARPLVVFEQRRGLSVFVARNDNVVLKADEGGQCDPFLDGGATIATKGRYFTIENGVACGQHWTDYITFRLDDRIGGFVFDNARQEAWELNPSNDPNAEALVRAGPPHVLRDQPGHPTPFAAWRPKR